MTTMTRTDLQAVVDRYIKAQQHRNPQELASFHTEDGVVESPMYGTLIGRAAIEEAYRAFYTSFNTRDWTAPPTSPLSGS